MGFLFIKPEKVLALNQGWETICKKRTWHAKALGRWAALLFRYRKP